MNKYHLYKVKLVKNAVFKLEASSPDAAIDRACQLADEDGMLWEHPVDEFICEEVENKFYCPICGSILQCYDTNPDLFYCLNEDECGTDWHIELSPEGKVIGVNCIGKFSF